MIAYLPTEEEDQIALIEWFDRCAPKALRGRLAAVPNGGFRLKRTATRLKAQGVRPGFPDLMLLVPRHGYAGLIIELKRRKGGVLSADQADWLNWLDDQGFYAEVCKGFDSARKLIAWYIEHDINAI